MILRVSNVFGWRVWGREILKMIDVKKCHFLAIPKIELYMPIVYAN